MINLEYLKEQMTQAFPPEYSNQIENITLKRASHPIYFRRDYEDFASKTPAD